MAADLKYRPEIDGLRAVAVVPVVLFHAGFGMFSGGFVGVDVFFVISGYLITGILLSDIAADRFSILRFYERRARRILPALFAVLLVCLPLAWFLLLPDEMARFGKSMLAVLGFVSNMTFWREEGYFTSASELKPLLHTWSLAVEEQFYIAFPLLLFLLRRLEAKKLAWVIALAALGSFLLSELAASRFALANFYLAPTRAWELLAGSLCACLGRKDGYRHAAWLGWLGLGAIVLAIFLLDGTYPFPSHWALLPVGGTMLLILFAQGQSGAGRLLAMRPMVGIGLVSYSLYLWHQPVFAFARLASNAALPRPVMLGLAALSLVLAVLSWRLIEQPFRKRDGLGAARVALPLALGSAALLALVGGWLYLSGGAPARFPPSRDPAILAMTRADPPPRADGGDCQPDADGFAEPCTLYDPPDAQGSIALFGDSHAQALLPAFREVARRGRLRLYYAAFGGCPPLSGVYVLNGNAAPEACFKLAASELAFARKARPDVTFLAGRWALYASEDPFSPLGHYLLADRPAPLLWSRADSQQALVRLLARTVADYRAASLPVVVLDQPPGQQVRVDRRLKQLALRRDTGGLDDEIARDSVSIAEWERLSMPYRPALAGTLPVVPLAPVFVRDGRYPWGAGGVSWYRDASHLSTPGALRTIPAVTAAYAAARAAR